MRTQTQLELNSMTPMDMYETDIGDRIGVSTGTSLAALVRVHGEEAFNRLQAYAEILVSGLERPDDPVCPDSNTFDQEGER
jgi:hypothetical protein